MVQDYDIGAFLKVILVLCLSQKLSPVFWNEAMTDASSLENYSVTSWLCESTRYCALVYGVLRRKKLYHVGDIGPLGDFS